MITLLEPSVTVTDYILTIECGVCSWLLHRRHRNRDAINFWFIVFFIALAIGALLGGTDHGFIVDKHSALHTGLWSATLLCTGVAAVAGWAIGAYLLFSDKVAAWITTTTLLVFTVYSMVILWIKSAFWVAIAHYLPATVFLLIALIITYARTHHKYLYSGIAGLGLTLVAAGVQQTGLALHPKYLDSNTLYHALQAFALLLIYLTARDVGNSKIPPTACWANRQTSK